MGSPRLEEMMVEAGILIPPDEEEDLEAYRDFVRQYREWKEEAGRELREKGDLE
jgi:hypothetical protein